MVEQLNNIAIGWWQWMSSMFWQVSLLIIIIFALDVLLRKKYSLNSDIHSGCLF